MTTLLTIPQAAELLGVCTWTVWQMRRRGDLPCGTLPGYRSVRIPREAVEELARRRLGRWTPRARRASRFVLEEEANQTVSSVGTPAPPCDATK